MSALVSLLCFALAWWVHTRSVWAARRRGMDQERERIRRAMEVKLKGHLATSLAYQLIDEAIDGES